MSVPAQTRRRVLIVEDHPVVREGIALFIGRQSDLIVVGAAADAGSGLRLVRDTDPEVMIVDLSLGQEGGLELIKAVSSSRPDIAILVLSMHDETVHAQRALRAGARGYVAKQEATDVLLEAVRTVLAGDVWVSPKVSTTLLRSLVGRAPKASVTAPRLSEREFEVLELLGAGLGTKDIAARLRLSAKTVESHRANIKEKLGLRTATQLVAYAARWASEEKAGSPRR